MYKKQMSIKKISFLGIMTTLALILSYVESLIPFYTGIPGVKLGLANLTVVFLLYRMSYKEAFLVSVMRILLSGFLFGNMMSILFSFVGTVFSVGMMSLLRRWNGFSVMGISIAGACMHNLGQLFVAYFTVKTSGLFFYVPVLLVSGVMTGFLIGIVGGLLLRYLPDMGNRVI